MSIHYYIPDSVRNIRNDFSPEAQTIIDSFRLSKPISSTAAAPLPSQTDIPKPGNLPQQQQQQQESSSPTLGQGESLQGPPVIVTSQYSYIEPIEYPELIDEVIGGDYHIVGEVQNVSPTRVESVEIIATLYDANNQVVGVETGYAELSTLFPNQKSPFEIVISGDQARVQPMSSYILAVDWR